MQLSDDYYTMNSTGPPPPPADLTTTRNSLGALDISWSLAFMDRVPVNFTLTVMNLNTSIPEPIIVPGIRDRHYTFTAGNGTLCDLYSFQITAVTDAVSSDPSEVIVSSIPSLPDTFSIEDSLQHSLVRTNLENESEILLNVTFKVNICSPEFIA